MWEQSKAARRRFSEGAFHTRYFVGEGIDIGGKPDPLGQYIEIFPLLMRVQTWDLEQGDAQFMQGVPDDHFDFVHSSHCLEHMHDARVALGNWARIVKPGGYLIVTVPDEDLYEHGHWPSRYNPDHKLLRDFVRAAVSADLDQTLTPVAECGIEIVWRKRGVDDAGMAVSYPDRK